MPRSTTAHAAVSARALAASTHPRRVHREAGEQQLAQACSSPEAQGEIIALNGCSKISDMSCLAQLEQMQVLDISGCSSMDGTTLATAIKGLK